MTVLDKTLSTLELTTCANDYYHEAEHHFQQGLKAAVLCGHALIEMKSRLPHGNSKKAKTELSWGDWLKKEFAGNATTATDYMRLAEKEAELVEMLRDPSGSINKALAQIAKPPRVPSLDVEEEREAKGKRATAWQVLREDSYALWNEGGDDLKSVESKHKRQQELLQVYRATVGVHPRPKIDPSVNVFMDSGSFHLQKCAKAFAEKHGCGAFDFYSSRSFFRYMDKFARFIKKHRVAIDYYTNVDAIPNPEISWRNQRYLESRHGLRPVPVVHFGTDLKWLRHYIDKGYGYIGLGGLVRSITKKECRRWLDDAFALVCDAPDHLPKVKVHGFGVGSVNVIHRYPWWSIDNTNWLAYAGKGNILVPHKEAGAFVFNRTPLTVAVTARKREHPQHYFNISKSKRSAADEWLAQLNFEWASDGESSGELLGLTQRRLACRCFYEQVRASVREYPSPYIPTQTSG